MDAGFLAVRAGLPTGVDALVCYNDQCAHGAILALLKDGLVPGRDILVIGCDNSALASSRALALTSIDPSPSPSCGTRSRAGDHSGQGTEHPSRAPKR